MHDAEYCRIPLRRRDGTIRAYATVDQADSHVAEFPWCMSTNGHAIRSVRLPDGRRRHLYLHRAILGLGFGDPQQGDHRNRDRLDNRRSNLRVVPPGANQQNVTPSGRTSPYRGVHWCKKARKWRAQAHINGSTRFLGQFDDELEAAAVAAAARAEHMPFATQ